MKENVETSLAYNKILEAAGDKWEKESMIHSNLAYTLTFDSAQIILNIGSDNKDTILRFIFGRLKSKWSWIAFAHYYADLYDFDIEMGESETGYVKIIVDKYLVWARQQGYIE
jgi:hypothetical protein